MLSSREPSLITATTGFNASTASPTSRTNLKSNKVKSVLQYKARFLWEGRVGRITMAIVLAPWNMWWQTIVIISILYKYVVHSLLSHKVIDFMTVLSVTMWTCEVFFIADVLIHLLHAFWPMVRIHVRVYRRNFILLFYDIMSIVPLSTIFHNNKRFHPLVILGRWMSIGRIYRLMSYCYTINEKMHRSRILIFLIEHAALFLLILHSSACMWYSLHSSSDEYKEWYQHLGYPMHVGSERLQFKNYMSCWYYCACRLFNTIFGDSFPTHDLEKLLTSALMIGGYVFLRYRFIGLLAWQSIIKDSRRLTFVDRYHHMITYLKSRGAPHWLVEQAKQFKLTLWRMKGGVLNSDHLHKLPLPLQMELIFDINVGVFHNTLLFRDTGEAFMRQISLLMRHEMFLPGQHVWSQGVVKSGMVCIKRGIVELLSDEDDESPMIAFKEGTILSELSLFYSIPAKVTVKAATYLEVQVLRRTDFMRAMAEQPFMLQNIREKIECRLKNSQRRQKAITIYDRHDSRLIRTRYRPMKVLKDHLKGVKEEDPAFIDDSHMYYRDEKNIRRAKFTPEFLELYEISNNVTTIEAPRICLRANFPWILEPDTNFTHIFDIFHFILVLYVSLMSPYIAILCSAQSNPMRVMNTIVITGLLLNIYIQLTTATDVKNQRKETVKEIAEVKMATFGFYLDILSVFPVYIFSDTLDPHGESVAGQVALLFPVLQAWHIWDYMNKWERNFNSNIKFICLIKFCLITCIFCYWSGCFLYLFACPRKLCRENSWMAQQIYKETKILMTNKAKHERPAMSSLSFGTSVFTGTGTSDLAPGVEDLLLVILIMILGTYLSCFYTAKICSIYMLSTQRRLKFKESMRELFYFLTVNHVSSKIKDRVKKFFCVQWYYNYAVSSEELFQDLSINIQQEVLAIEMVDTLMYCPLFQDCCLDFLQTVAAYTRVIVLPDNETVQHAADIGRDMYILQKGHCNILNHCGKAVSSIGPGNHFGVLEMLFGLPKVYTIMTTTNCVLFHLEYSALVQCWGTFPDISHPIITALDDAELLTQVKCYETAKPLTGKLDAKINRIAQELKESFVVFSGRQERAHYIKEFDKLGILRFLRYIIIPICITPHGIFLKLWCTFRFILAVFYVFTVPYNIATKKHKFSSSIDWVDIILYFDLIIMAHVAYYDERSLLITHPLLTISRYLKRGFILDIITVFPIEHLFSIINDKTNLDVFRMNKILQVTRITGAFSFWESDIMRVSEAVVLLKFLPIVVALVNFVSAFIFTNSCRTYLSPDSYFVMANCTRALIVSGNKYEIKYATAEYIYTFYWVFETFVGCGCAPVVVSNNTDVVLTMALQITGFLYFAFMFGHVASTRSAAAHSLLDHVEKTKDLANFLYQQNVEPILTAKTLKYFEYVWKRTNGSNPQLPIDKKSDVPVVITFYQLSVIAIIYQAGGVGLYQFIYCSSQICRRLNSALMEDTLVFMYERTLREVPLFSKVERSFIRVITQHLNEMYFLKGETVIQYKDIQPYIFIIYRGKVDVLTSYNEMITCMGPGGMFGNFTGKALSCSEVSIYASRSLDLLVINSQTFFNLVKYYPKIQEPLYKAFEMSKDYILPISMDLSLSDTSSAEDSDNDLLSMESAVDSRSGSSRYDMQAGQVSLRSSQSNMSHTKSSLSTSTYASYTNIYNLFTPGTWMFQTFGYICCLMATANYVLLLYELITLNDCVIIFWLQAIFDIFFYIKTYLTIHQGYVSKRGDFILEPYKCQRRYFRHKMHVWSDILVNFPIELLGFCCPSPLTAMHYLRANKLFRLKYLVEFYRKTAAELTNNLTTLQSAMTFFVVILLIHTFTCIWLLVLIAMSPFSIIRTLKINVMEQESQEKRWDYTTSLYVVVSELTATGGDEFVIDSIVAMAILAICLICGKMLAAIVVATSMQVAFSSKHALSTYEKDTGELIDVLKNQGLSNYQLKKFWTYVQQLWTTERGRQLPALLEKTPYVRRCDLMSAMFGQYLRNCYIFSDTGEQFLRQLTVVLDYTIFFPGNYIVVAGDSEARMHWVASGLVSVVSVRPDLTETTHEVLGPGDEFGILQGLNRGTRHYFSYRAETKVSILTLNLDSWIDILPFFPEANRIIAEKSEMLFTQL